MEIILKLRKLLLVALTVLAFASCKKNSVDNSAKPVVVGMLIPGQPITIHINQQKGLSDTSTYGIAITGLNVSISDGSKTVTLTDAGGGVYTYTDLSFLAGGKTYKLQFNYLNTIVSATTQMPAKPATFTATRTTLNLPLSTTTASQYVATTFAWDNPDSLNHLLVFKSDENDPFDIHATFNSSPDFTINVKKAASYDAYYSLFNYIGGYKAILFRVNQEYVNMLTTNANTNSQRLTDAPTNINNGYGVFTAMQSDTIKLMLTQY
jgi:hypothetical protein